MGMAGKPCEGCGRIMQGRRERDLRYDPTKVRACGNGRCSTCYKRSTGGNRRQYAAAIPVERQPHDRLNTIKLPAGPLLDAIALLELDNDSGPIWQAICRARRTGSLSVAAADLIAVRLLRTHPYTIWGDAWWDPAEFGTAA